MPGKAWERHYIHFPHPRYPPIFSLRIFETNLPISHEAIVVKRDDWANFPNKNGEFS